MYDKYNRRCFLERSAGIGIGLAMGCISLAGCNNQYRKEASEKGDSELIAYCGQNCVECRIYLATRETDLKKQRQMREQIANYITKQFGTETRLEDVTDCDGCTTKDGKLFSECQKCQIRKCAREKGFENCAYCSEYACDKLSKLFDSGSVEADAKKRLDEIKARL
jgi:hypothetical protein